MGAREPAQSEERHTDAVRLATELGELSRLERAAASGTAVLFGARQ
jgi:hypothetical protein